MNKALRIGLPIVVLLGGVGVLVTLIKTRPSAKKVDPSAQTIPVEAISLEPVRETVLINAMGTVSPAREVVLSAEVSGRVVSHDPRMVVGGQFKKGEVLLRIDPRNYQLAVAQHKANLERAAFELKVERGRVRVAEREWSLLDKRPDTESEGKELALRKPHLANAEAAMAAAQSALERAELDVERTTVRAPFDGFIKAENVEVGQYLSPGQQLATLVGSEEFWVQVSVPLDRLSWIKLPKDTGEPGSEATLSLDAGPGESTQRTGQVVRLLGELDPVGRMARVVVSVRDPFASGEGQPSLPLLLGSFVTVSILGDALDDVYVIPRAALHAGDSVLIATSDDRLEIRKIDIAWRKSDVVYVASGLKPGERLITSRVPTVLAGAALEVRMKDENGRARAARLEPAADVVAPRENR